MTNSNRREDVQKIILALLLAHKNPVDIMSLENEYTEQEGENVPWRSFGHVSLLDFLQSMPQILRIERRGNRYYVRGMPTDRSKHVSSLVSRQRLPTKKPVVRRMHRPSHYYPRTERPRVQLPAEGLSYVVNLVKQNPKGISKDYLLTTIHKNYPYVCLQDLEHQLRELSHEVTMDNNMIRPAKTNEPVPKVIVENFPIEWPKDQPQRSASSPKYYVSDGEDYFDDYDSDDNMYFSSKYDQYEFRTGISPSIDKKSTCSFLQESVAKHQKQLNKNTDAYNASEAQEDNVISHCHDHDPSQGPKDDVTFIDNDSTQILVNERIRIRLQHLIQKYKHGIWCADLPQKYLEEYKIDLKYTELGFNSVREFASHLKDIFHCVQPWSTGDCILYDAKEIAPNSEKKPEQTLTLAELYNMQYQDDVEAMPAIISTDTSKKLIPEGVMTIGEMVGHLCVESLMNDIKPFVEVYVVEVFTPSFFWVQLRKKKKCFETLMTDLDRFYTEKYRQYAVPPVVLEKGLNCACIYGGKWHRGIIKSVDPDLRVTVLFYDYGTLKTYAANEIYYLHRTFSSVPAQAIPCGLINTKPVNGDHWPKRVTYEFAIKTSQIPLIATIGSVHIDNNSMMVTLTNTLEDEDIHINDWLVEQNLAVHGKMVRIRSRNFPFHYYVKCRELLKKFCQISEDYAKSVKHANKSLAKSFREKMALCDSRTILTSTLNSNKDHCQRVEVHCPPESRSNPGLGECSVKLLESEVGIRNHSSNVERDTTNSALPPSGAKELVSLYEQLRSLDSTQTSTGSSSVTTGNKVLARQNIDGVSQLDSKTPNSDVTKRYDNPNLSSRSLPGHTLEKSRERTKTEISYEALREHCDIKVSRKKCSSVDVNEKVRQEQLTPKQTLLGTSENLSQEYSPMKQSRYCFSPVNSVCQDADDGKFFGDFKSLYGGRGRMAPIDWSDACGNVIPDEPKKLTPKLSKSNETPSDTLRETCNTSSVNLPSLANPYFLNIMRHSLYSENEVVCRPPDGNLNRHQNVSELVFRRKKTYLQNNDRVIGVPQTLLSVLRGGPLSEADLTGELKVDTRKATEQKDLYTKMTLVKSDEETTKVRELKQDVDGVIKHASKSNSEITKYESSRKDQINISLNSNSNTSSELNPESSNSFITTSENVISSSDANISEVMKVESSFNNICKNPQMQEQFAPETLKNEECTERESLHEHKLESNESSAKNIVSADFSIPSSRSSNQRSRILEIMERYSNLHYAEIDSDDYSSVEESKYLEHSTCSLTISESLENEGKQESEVIEESEEPTKEPEVVYHTADTEAGEECMDGEELETRKISGHTEIPDKISAEESLGCDESTEVQQTSNRTASVPVYAPVFNDVDINSEDDSDEWDAFMGTYTDTREEELNSCLKIEELNDNCLPEEGKIQTPGNGRDDCESCSTVSGRVSITNGNTPFEQTNNPGDRSLMPFFNVNTADDNGRFQPSGNRRTLIGLLDKLGSVT